MSLCKAMAKQEKRQTLLKRVTNDRKLRRPMITDVLKKHDTEYFVDFSTHPVMIGT